MNLEGIVLSETGQAQKDGHLRIPLHEVPRVELIETRGW